MKYDELISLIVLARIECVVVDYPILNYVTRIHRIKVSTWKVIINDALAIWIFMPPLPCSSKCRAPTSLIYFFLYFFLKTRVDVHIKHIQ